jgi:hypothetical protein
MNSEHIQTGQIDILGSPMDHDSTPFVDAGKVRRNRDKKILTNRTTGESLFVKHVTKQIDFNAVTNLSREYSFLLDLENSGVTPKPLQLEISPDGTEGAIGMEVLVGKSIATNKSRLRRASNNARNTLIRETLNSLQVVHGNNICIGDISAGSFIMSRDNHRRLNVKIVDFEYAFDRNEIVSGISDVIQRNCSRHDIGFYIKSIDSNINMSFEDIASSERYETSMILLDVLLGESFSWEAKDLIAEEESKEFENQYNALLPYVRQRTEAKIVRRYAYKGIDRAREIAQQDGRTLTREEMKAVMIYFSLPYLLHQRGIELDPLLVRKLQKNLNPDMSKRD